MSTDQIQDIQRALIALGWPEGGFIVQEDGPQVGDWRTYMAFTTHPGGTLVDVWAGPGAGRDPAEIIIAGQPLRKAQLRALIGSAGATRQVAQIAVKTAGHGRELGDVETGESKGLPGALEGRVHPARLEQTPAGRELVFFARTHAGAYVRVHAALDGEGLVALSIEPPGPGTGMAEFTASPDAPLAPPASPEVPLSPPEGLKPPKPEP